MGYRVDYGQARQKRPSFFSKNRVWILTAVFLLLFALAVKVFWPKGTEMLCRLLLLGKSEQSAFAELVENLRSGQGFTEAVTAFCREIFADAGISLQ